MPRRKPTAAATAAPISTKSHKRAISTASSAPNASHSTPSTRASKRLKESDEKTPTNSNVTPKKSKYFEATDSNEDLSESSADEETESGYEDAKSSVTQDSEHSSESEEYTSAEESKPAKKRGKKPKSQSTTPQVNSEDLWREGVKTGLGPGKQVFIAKPKPKGDGGIKYVPDKIHPNTMTFLADLRKNNDREWLKRHDPDYRQSWKDWESYVETLTEKIAEVDETIPELPPKDLVFRIYRDVRFSSDPTPYKPHFSAAWSRTGRKGPYAAYYVQIQPGGRSFVGGGLWHPEAQPLALIRRSIDRRPERLRSLLTNDSIRKHLLGGVTKDEKKAIKAFCDQNAENALKTKPKGYDADHANIELLRLRNFTIGKRLTDTEVLSAEGLNKVMQLISAMHPFITYLNSVVMPDEGDDDDDDNDSEGENDSNDD